MAIGTGTGGAANSGAVNVGSQAAPSLAFTTGRDVVVNVVLGSTTSSVSSITASAGSFTSSTLKKAQNGTGVRVEVWTLHVTTGATAVLTANIAGGNTTCSIEVEEYSGISSFGNTNGNNGNDNQARTSAVTQDDSNFVVFGMGFACVSGDTVGGGGTIRQSSIPAATSVGGVLSDVSAVGVATFEAVDGISAVRQWAIAALELRSGNAANSFKDYAATSAPTLQVARDIRYLNVLMPLSFGGSPGSTNVPLWGTFGCPDGYVGQIYDFEWYLERCGVPVTYTIVSGALPTGLSISSAASAEGIISGTPTTIGTYSFTVRATNSYGFADKPLVIIIHAAGSGGAYTFLD